MKRILSVLFAVAFTVNLTAVTWNEDKILREGETTINEELYVGGNNGNGSLLLGGAASFWVKGLVIGNGQGSSGSLVLQDNAVLTVESDGRFNIGRNAMTKGYVTIKDNARMTLLAGNGVYLSGGNDNEAAEARFVQEGGVIDASGRTLGLNGTNAVVELKGGVSAFNNWDIQGIAYNGVPYEFFTNRIVVTGGEHTSKGLISLTTVNAMSMLSIEGGRVKANVIKIGAESGSGTHLVQLLGGELLLKSYSATALGRFVADGGTIIDSNLSCNIANFILGEKGLTFKSHNDYLTVTQEFKDAEGVEGRFIKTGPLNVTVWQSSSHAITEVNDGELVMKSNKFGKKIIVRNNSILSIGNETQLVADTLVLGGEDGSAGVLKPGVDGTSLTVGALVVNCGVIDLTNVANGETILTSGNELDESALSKLSPLKKEAGKDYIFSLSEDKKSIVFTLADLDESVNTTITESTTDAGNKTLKGNVTVSGGKSVFTGNVDMKGVLVFNVAGGSSLDLAGGINANADVVKLGGGRLVLSGNIVNNSGNWGLTNGVIEVNNQNAFGMELPPDSAITLSSGTLRFGEGEAATVEHAVRIAAPGQNDRVIISTDRDLVLKRGIDSSSGTFIKTGRGNITVELGDGTYYFGTKNDMNNAAPATTALPDDGSSPVAPNNTAAMEVLAGEMTIKGEGPDVSKVRQTQPLFIGTAWTGTVAQAGLVLDSVGYTHGGASRQLVIGNGVKSGMPNNPYLKLLNSKLDSNTITIGGGDKEIHPQFEAVNSKVTMIYALNIGTDNDNVYPNVRIREGSDIRVYRSSGSSQGINLCKNIDSIVSDGSVLASVANGDKGNNGITLNDAAFGIMKFVNGGTLETYEFTDLNTDAAGTGHVDFVFDGGVLRMTDSGETKFVRPCQGFTTTGGGMEINIGDGITHMFSCPFRGDGAIVKTGAGTLVFGMNGDNASVTNGGGVVVKEGVMQISAGVLGDGASVNVMEGATLDLGGDAANAVAVGGVNGAGTVQNGLLAGAIKVDIDNASLDGIITLGAEIAVKDSGFKVAFVYEDELTVKGQTVPVCRLGDGVPVDYSLWKASGLPEGLGAEFFATEGVVYATIKSAGGTVIIVR